MQFGVKNISRATEGAPCRAGFEPSLEKRPNCGRRAKLIRGYRWLIHRRPGKTIGSPRTRLMTSRRPRSSPLVLTPQYFQHSVEMLKHLGSSRKVELGIELQIRLSHLSRNQDPLHPLAPGQRLDCGRREAPGLFTAS